MQTLGGIMAWSEYRSWLKEHWKALVVILIIGLLPFLSVIFSGHILFASDQIGAPAWKFYFDALRHGEIPLWNPYGLAGMPTFDAMFGDASFPPFIVLGLLLPVSQVVTWDFILHVLVAGFGAFILTQRYFRLNTWLATALAVAYMFNTNFISDIHSGHTAKFFIMAWLPLSIYFLLRVLGPVAARRHLVGLALTIALFISTSHLQFTYYVLMGYFLIWLYFLFPPLRQRNWVEVGKLALRFWVPILLGIGLVFFIFYPPLKYTKEFGIRGSGANTTFEHAASWSLHPEEAAALVVPEFAGLNENYWGRNPFKLNSEYPGLLVWFLGLLGLFAFRNRWYWFWGSVGLLSILYGLGAHTPLFRVVYEIVPGVKNFRAPSMILFWLATALLLMSAETLRRLSEGIEKWPETARAKAMKRFYLVGFGAAGLAALCGLMPDTVFSIWDSVFDASQIPNIARQAMDKTPFAIGALRTGALLAILTWGAGAFLLKTRRPALFGWLALTVTVVDLYWVNANFISGYDPSRVLPHEEAIDVLKADTSRFRVLGIGQAYDRWFMQYHGIETVDGWTDNEMRTYRTYRGNDYQTNPNLMAGLKENPDGSVSGSPFLDLLNVKYLAYRLPNDPGLKLARNNSALPRAFFVPAWQALSDSDALLKMKEPGFNPRRLAYVSGVGLSSGGNLSDTSDLAHIGELKHSYNQQVYRVETAAPGIFIVSGMWFPNWKVKLDGMPVPLLRTDYAFRGVQLTAGKHTVAFHYRSPWLRTGLWVAVLSLLALVSSSFLLFPKRRNTTTSAAAT